MKIQEATVGLSSSHAIHQEVRRKESMRFWVGDQRPVFAGEEEAAPVRISEAARQLGRQAVLPPQPAAEAPTTPENTDPRLEMIRRILEALTGKKITLAHLEPAPAATPTTPVPGSDAAPPRQGWGLEYDLEQTRIEEEALALAAAGQVVTSDGQSFSFSLSLAMARSEQTSSAFHLRAGDALLVDPLVINLTGNPASLGDLRFAFDLDADGDQEAMPFVGQGSGLLAWDRNRDGVVNNGLELFGPASGNGFSELTTLDHDGNGWLDENDPRFAELSLWMKDAAGNDSLESLRDHRIGAILLTAVETPFVIKAGEALAGQLRETSVFLREDGAAGTVQELDLAV
ncbi:MAG: hypothetical protein ACOY3Z_06515 [Thermodesulfobacteriota bacterium]